MRASERVEILLGIVLCTLGSTPWAWGSTADLALETAFRHPQKAERPIVRWWWPGGAVDDEELRRQIGLLDDAGIGGVEIQPFSLGIVGATAAERAAIDSYATPPFFDHVRAASAAALAHGLKLDYTLGSAWPSGGGLAITPEAALLELTMAATSVTGGVDGPIHVAIPKRTPRLGAFPSFDQRYRRLRIGRRGWRHAHISSLCWPCAATRRNCSRRICPLPV